jgi:lipopolysaccharide/colanic/teichoic acid biosynthesis glycosyltransferase
MNLMHDSRNKESAQQVFTLDSIKPGLTCILQISDRRNLSFTKLLELEHIGNWSLWPDSKILFKTHPVVLRSKGAV